MRDQVSRPRKNTGKIIVLYILIFTQQTQETNIHAPFGIRARDPSNRTAVHLRVRQHGTKQSKGKSRHGMTVNTGLGPTEEIPYSTKQQFIHGAKTKC
jgi:hypothetical protein